MPVETSKHSSTAILAAHELSADQQPALVFLAGLASAHSRRNMQRYLNQMARLLGTVPDLMTIAGEHGHRKQIDNTFLHVPWQALRFQHVQALKAQLAETYAAATVNGMLSALRGVLKAAWKLDLLSAEDYHKAIDTNNIQVDTLPTGRDVKVLEIKALFETCNLGNAPTAKDVRDAALLALLYATGMRRAEAANLNVEAYDADNGQIKVLRGKGRKDRTVYIAGKAKKLLDVWFAVRGQHGGSCWHFIDRWGNIHKERGISSQAIYDMLKTRAIAAGIDDFSPHDLRRTFVGNALDAGIDMATVANIAGHASTDTTRRYDRRGERAKEQAAHKIDLPI